MNNHTLPINPDQVVKLSLVIPCYNEVLTLESIVGRILAIQNKSLSIELIIVDDCSTDGSLGLARRLEKQYNEVIVVAHPFNQGKGAALHTGFARATGDLVGVNDADEEYDPTDLPRLIRPIVEGKADVVYGSRYRKDEPRRVLYFWHSVMNRTLTTISNMFTDMDLTDMETCYKIFRREVIKSLDLREKRFGFEPEITAKLAQHQYRVYEMGISYSPRTYEEGKKIGWRDGKHALYCIFHYSAPIAPLPIQLLIYTFIGGLAALCNISLFLLLMKLPLSVPLAAAIAYGLAATINYLLCISLLFRHKAHWNTAGELTAYTAVVLFSGLVDISLTTLLVRADLSGLTAKAIASLLVLILNFMGRRGFVFKEPAPAEHRKPSQTNLEKTTGTVIRNCRK